MQWDKWGSSAKRKIMKHLFSSKGIAGGLLAASLMGPAVMANSTITLYQGPYSYGDGGEFTGVIGGSPNLINLGEYSPFTSTANSFQTFCVQVGVEFTPGTTYNYTASLNSTGTPEGFP